MGDIIAAIRDTLRESSDLPYLRGSDVWISPTVNYMPEQVRTIGAGICPGTEARVEKVGGLFDVTRTVRVALFVSMMKPEAVVIGDAVNPGTTDITAAVDGVLHDNFLGLSVIESAFCRTISEPVLFGNKAQAGRLLVRVIMDYQYESEEEEP